MEDKIVKCLLCGGTTKLLEQNYPGYQEPETFRIYYCPCCNTSFSLPRVETEPIYQLIYQNTDKLRGYARYWKYMNAVKDNINPLQYLAESEETYWSVKSVLSKVSAPKKTLKIIEVGCGLGYLTYALISDGYNAVGMDISQNAVNEAIKNFGKHYICANVMEYAVQHKESYDIVILTEVIEHIEEPVAFLKSLMSLLNKSNESQIILTTPNKTIYSANIIWNTDLPPVHLWWFSEDSMRFIASKINANVQFIDFRDYYHKNKKKYYKRKKQRNIREIKHTFSSDGKIIEQFDNLPHHRKLYSILAKIPLLKYIYCKINPNRFVSGKRGWILGTVFKIKANNS
jgi:2-polyprenyl-3-methyl-5-hydroxy-6-metoxy-1,4-benzoquinol methylase